MKKTRRVVSITGPLAQHKNGLIDDLRCEGYTPLSINSLLYLTEQLSRWLERENIDPVGLTVRRIERFLRHRRRCGYYWHPTIQGLNSILNPLRRLGVIPAAEHSAPQRTALTDLIDRYGEYLIKERALTPDCTREYQNRAQSFLVAALGTDTSELRRLSTADVSAFILSEARRCSVGYAKFKATALRSFLRYLHVRAEIGGDLSGAVPAIAGWRLANLPKGLERDQVRRLLLAFDRRTRAGRRGYAIVILMLRLGLRSCEVATLRLADCDWSRVRENRKHGLKGGFGIGVN